MLIISLLIKLSPERWVESVPVKIDEQKPLGEDNKLV